MFNTPGSADRDRIGSTQISAKEHASTLMISNEMGTVRRCRFGHREEEVRNSGHASEDQPCAWDRICPAAEMLIELWHCLWLRCL